MNPTRRPRRHASLAPIIACLLVAAGCGDTNKGAEKERLSGIPTEGDPELIRYLKDSFGVTLTGVDIDPNFYIDDDGDARFETDFTIAVDGLGERALYLDEVIYSAANGGGVCLFISDPETGAQRYFDFHTTENYIRFSQDLRPPDDPQFVERGAAVGRNPDGTYTVWTFDAEVDGGRENETTVATGYEALELVNAYADFNTIPPHIMLAAVAFGHTPVPENRTSALCMNTALRPSVCSLFREFCDCAACATLDREGNCSLCPDL